MARSRRIRTNRDRRWARRLAGIDRPRPSRYVGTRLAQRLERSLAVRRRPRDVAADRILIGDQVGMRATRLAQELGQLRVFSTPVARSVYALAGNGDLAAPRQFVGWVRAVARVRPWHGHTAGASDAELLLARAVSPGPRATPGPIVVRPVGDGWYQTVDGHHRIAELGRGDSISVRVSPFRSRTPLQRFLAAHDRGAGRDILQPIEGLSLNRGPIEDELQAYAVALRALLLDHESSSGSFIDIDCRYGWLVRWAESAGYEAFGASANELTSLLAREAYGVAPERILPSEALRSDGGQSFDVVHWRIDTIERERFADVASLAHGLIVVSVAEVNAEGDSRRTVELFADYLNGNDEFDAVELRHGGPNGTSWIVGRRRRGRVPSDRASDISQKVV